MSINKIPPGMNKLILTCDEEPVAEALYEGQYLYESVIHLGKYTVAGKEIHGSFRWAPEECGKKVVFGDKNIYKYYFYPAGAQTSVQQGMLKVNVYKRENDKAFAFVWHSEGRRTKLGLNDNELVEKYPNLLDSYSLEASYNSRSSFEDTKPEDAARNAARALFQMPKGRRSISIDGWFSSLMGGAIDQADRINIPKMSGDDSLEQKIAIKNEQLIAWKKKEELYSIVGENGDGYVFYDKPIHYKNTVDRTNEKLLDLRQKLVGIQEGTSSCQRIAEFLSRIFKEMAELGVEIDYYTVDIEGVDSNSWTISTQHRLIFGKIEVDKAVAEERKKLESLHRKLTGSDNAPVELPLKQEQQLEEYRTVLNKEAELQARQWDKLWISISGRDEIWSLFKERGFYPIDDAKKAFLALQSAHTSRTGNVCGDYEGGYLERRNLNIFDSVMKSYTNSLFQKYVVEPVLAYYPNIKASVYGRTEAAGYINYATRNESYLGGTTFIGSDMYPSPTLYGNYCSYEFEKLAMDDRRIYIPYRTAFAYVQADVNELRQALLSSDKPLIPYAASHYFWPGIHYDFISNEEAFGNAVSNQKISDYHKEMLFHLWLSNPLAVYAYFNHGDIKKDYPPYAGFHKGDTMASETYYTKVYNHFQYALAEINSILPCPVDGHLIKELTLGTDHHIISGARCGEYNVWRITLDLFEGKDFHPELADKFSPSYYGDSGIQIQTQNKIIRFITYSRVQQTACGYWVITPCDAYPEVSVIETSGNDSPALLLDINYNDSITSNGNDKGIIYSRGSFQKLNHLTVFGEFAQSFLARATLRFNCDVSSSGTYHILQCSWNKQQENKQLVKGKQLEPFHLIKGTDYTFEAEVSFNRNTNGTDHKKWQLFLCTEEGRTVINECEEARDSLPTTPKGYLAQTMQIHSSDVISCSKFSLYQTGANVKFEVFRLYDGVNISRVNRSIKGLEYVHTFQDDRLIGKLSWLNASGEDICYTVLYEQLNNNMDLLDICTVTSRIVKRNDEGYAMIPLPHTRSGVRNIRTTIFNGYNPVSQVIIPIDLRLHPFPVPKPDTDRPIIMPELPDGPSRPLEPTYPFPPEIDITPPINPYTEEKGQEIIHQTDSSIDKEKEAINNGRISDRFEKTER